MEKYKFNREYNFRASPKMLYNYFATPGGLQQWFAQSVSIDGDGNFLFDWGNKAQKAQVVAKRINKAAKFEFTEGENAGNYIEFKLENSNLDSSCYLYITDYSWNSDEDDLIDLWDGFIDTLKDIVGG